MDNEQLLNAIQELLESMEIRLTKRMDSIDRKVSLHAGVLAHMVEWNDKFESEMVRISAELAQVQTRLAKLEGAA